jgi:glycosyltransferase involved in cell wall biosynthesis/acetyltransferase-like isoleucine patch superfamily enzyme
MIKSKIDYIYYMQRDKIAQKKENSSLKIIHYLGLGEQIWVFLSLLRKLEYIKNCKSGIFWKIIFNFVYLHYTRLSMRLGFSIPLNTLGAGTSIIHRGTVVINKDARIGKNSRIHVCTNIGAFNGGAPKIGDNVYIGPGAKIFGDIEIADGIAIGANAVVNSSFLEKDISIGGIPAKKISDRGSLGLIPISTHKKKIKLLFILPLLNGGGAERVVINLLNHLDRDKFTVVLALLEKKGRYIDDIPKDIETIDLKVSKVRYSIFKIAKAIRKTEPDIVFSTLGYLNLFISTFRILFPKETIFIGRESTIVSIANKKDRYPALFDFLYKNFYQNFDLIISQSNYMKSDLVDNYGIPSNMIKVVNNPVDVKKIDEMSNKADNSIYPKNIINLLAVGRLKNRTKGFDNLIDIVNGLEDIYHLTILGEGEDREILEKQIKTLKLENRVTLIGFKDNPYSYMKHADILLLTSHYEGFPNVILEANLCGTPVIAFDSEGGIKEIVKNGLNGQLVEKGNMELFAKEITYFDFEEYNPQKIRKYIVEKYSIDKIIKIYENIFLESKGMI